MYNLPRQPLGPPASLHFPIHAFLPALVALIDNVQAVLQRRQHARRRRTERDRLALEVARPQIAAQLQRRHRSRRPVRVQLGARVKVPLQRVDLPEQDVLERLDLVHFLAQIPVGALQTAAAGRRQRRRLQRHGAVVPAQRGRVAATAATGAAAAVDASTDAAVRMVVIVGNVCGLRLGQI